MGGDKTLRSRHADPESGVQVPEDGTIDHPVAIPSAKQVAHKVFFEQDRSSK